MLCNYKFFSNYSNNLFAGSSHHYVVVVVACACFVLNTRDTFVTNSCACSLALSSDSTTRRDSGMRKIKNCYFENVWSI